MAENQYIEPSEKKKSSSKKKRSTTKKLELKWKKPAFLEDQRFKLSIGATLIAVAMGLFFAFSSYFFTGKTDQTVVYDQEQTLIEKGLDAENKIGYSGSLVSHYFIHEWFGIGVFLFIPVIFFLGWSIITGKQLPHQVKYSKGAIFLAIWSSVLLGFIVSNSNHPTELIYYCGGTGYFIAHFLNGLIGWGTFLILILTILIFSVYFFEMGYLFGIKGGTKTKEKIEEEIEDEEFDEEIEEELTEETNITEETEIIDQPIKEKEVLEETTNKVTEDIISDLGESLEFEVPKAKPKPKSEPNLDLELEAIIPEVEEETEGKVDENLAMEIGEKVEEKESKSDTADLSESYDPTLDLSHYKYPTIDLLQDNSGEKVQVSREELEANKNNIVETLRNYKIGISHIKATIGPTVTLYEIIPEAGVKISKIKNLEDDIALSLAALGIRIIAPIPGKGTIGIEVPNKNRELVGFRSVLNSEKFMKSDMALPVVMGRTITNEIFMLDLAKMPHILMAGATGQGKSVGLNVLLASLLYKKHPAQLKFVLVDPKKVELSIFEKIERHFLAKLPDEEDAIITDTSKVINTLNSLCIEMDNRYDLLKTAGCRNLKEYNGKFIARKLNPEKGHKFMPYIVLVIDELADLMMTAGKEVENPIARLAQLARAIGIHLVVATQRPSVNVITGIIKANFPARISFKVTSRIDSRTILDSGGAEQLIGMGDMLFSQGSEITRVQCAFVDTPEIDNIVDFIGEQQGYGTAFQLPEYVGESGGDQKSGVDLSDRDVLFEDAARMVVINQQGSTSLIQRKLKLGYNRAGRIMDQLEAARVVGPFQGAKARDVLVPDEFALEQLLQNLS